MKSIVIVCLVTLLAVSTSTAGEYQRYVDENGVVRYSDSLTEVPKERRKTLTTHDTQATPAATDPNASGTPTVQPAPAAPAPTPESTPTAPAATATLPDDATIADLRAALDEEYAQLLAEKNSLDKELGGGIATVEANRAYQDKVTALNQRIAIFEQKRTALNERINAHNAKRAESQNTETSER